MFKPFEIEIYISKDSLRKDDLQTIQTVVNSYSGYINKVTFVNTTPDDQLGKWIFIDVICANENTAELIQQAIVTNESFLERHEKFEFETYMCENDPNILRKFVIKNNLTM